MPFPFTYNCVEKFPLSITASILRKRLEDAISDWPIVITQSNDDSIEFHRRLFYFPPPLILSTIGSFEIESSSSEIQLKVHFWFLETSIPWFIFAIVWSGLLVPGTSVSDLYPILKWTFLAASFWSSLGFLVGVVSLKRLIHKLHSDIAA